MTAILPISKIRSKYRNQWVLVENDNFLSLLARQQFQALTEFQFLTGK